MGGGGGAGGDHNRKQNHCEIEKRRRDKMNHYITELASVIPALDNNQSKLDKLTVLRMAVQHVKSLRSSLCSFSSFHLRPSFLSSGNLLKNLILQMAGQETEDTLLMVVTCDRGKVLFVSGSSKNILNQDQHDLVGQSLFDVLHKDDVSKVKEQITYYNLCPKKMLVDSKTLQPIKSNRRDSYFQSQNQANSTLQPGSRRSFFCRMKSGHILSQSAKLSSSSKTTTTTEAETREQLNTSSDNKSLKRTSQREGKVSTKVQSSSSMAKEAISGKNHHNQKHGANHHRQHKSVTSHTKRSEKQGNQNSSKSSWHKRESKSNSSESDEQRISRGTSATSISSDSIAGSLGRHNSSDSGVSSVQSLRKASSKYIRLATAGNKTSSEINSSLQQQQIMVMMKDTADYQQNSIVEFGVEGMSQSCKELRRAPIDHEQRFVSSMKEKQIAAVACAMDHQPESFVNGLPSQGTLGNVVDKQSSKTAANESSPLSTSPSPSSSDSSPFSSSDKSSDRDGARCETTTARRTREIPHSSCGSRAGVDGGVSGGGSGVYGFDGFDCKPPAGASNHGSRNVSISFDRKQWRYIVMHCTGYLKSLYIRGDEYDDDDDDDDDADFVERTLGDATINSDDETISNDGRGNENHFRTVNCLVAVCRRSVMDRYLKPDKPLTFTCRYSMDGKFTFVDQRTTVALGYMPQQLLGTSHYAYCHEGSVKTFKECHRQCILKAEPISSDVYQFKRANGQSVWLQTSLKSFRNPWTKLIDYIVANHTTAESHHSKYNEGCVPTKFNQDMTDGNGSQSASPASSTTNSDSKKSGSLSSSSVVSSNSVDSYASGANVQVILKRIDRVRSGGLQHSFKSTKRRGDGHHHHHATGSSGSSSAPKSNDDSGNYSDLQTCSSISSQNSATSFTGGFPNIQDGGGNFENNVCETTSQNLEQPSGEQEQQEQKQEQQQQGQSGENYIENMADVGAYGEPQDVSQAFLNEIFDYDDQFITDAPYENLDGTMVDFYQPEDHRMMITQNHHQQHDQQQQQQFSGSNYNQMMVQSNFDNNSAAYPSTQQHLVQYNTIPASVETNSQFANRQRSVKSLAPQTMQHRCYSSSTLLTPNRNRQQQQQQAQYYIHRDGYADQQQAFDGFSAGDYSGPLQMIEEFPQYRRQEVSSIINEVPNHNNLGPSARTASNLQQTVHYGHEQTHSISTSSLDDNNAATLYPMPPPPPPPPLVADDNNLSSGSMQTFYSNQTTDPCGFVAEHNSSGPIGIISASCARATDNLPNDLLRR